MRKVGSMTNQAEPSPKVSKKEIKKSKEFIDTHGEYSKKVLNKFIIMWFVGAFFGMFVVSYELFFKEETHLEAWLLYIGGPVTGGIITYLIKSMKEKINLALKLQGIEQQKDFYGSEYNPYYGFGGGSDFDANT